MTPDEIVLWSWRGVALNATIVYTWIVAAVLVAVALHVTGRFAEDRRPTRLQVALEFAVEAVRNEVRSALGRDSDACVAFVGTLFLFIAASNLLDVVPGFVPPTVSLSTTVALALCVFFAVPVFAIVERGPWNYLRSYLRPTPLMLPFHVIGELSRTLALAVRLFGNSMSAARIGALLLAVVPLLFPILLQVLGLITGLVQAYIFAALALVYMASAARSQDEVARVAHPPAAPADTGNEE